MEESKSRPDQRRSRQPGGTRTPNEGESSSSDNTIVPEGATIADPGTRAPSKAFDPDATLVDLDATVVDVPQRRTSSAGRRSTGLFVSAAVLEIGDVLGGRYEILQLLGEGGMGAVYKAKDRELDRFVALKLIRPELASSPAILARFKQELLLAHQVTHKNVIRIYDLAEADGVKFITMEFIEGVDLRHLLHDRGKLPPNEAVEIIQQVCLALDAAHSVGVMHRDLKPQNIMQDKTGPDPGHGFRPGSLDWVRGHDPNRSAGWNHGVHVAGTSHGQRALDQRSDLFALGLIFFELLTGKVPYKADTAIASLLKRSQERAIPAVSLEPLGSPGFERYRDQVPGA